MQIVVVSSLEIDMNEMVTDEITGWLGIIMKATMNQWFEEETMERGLHWSPFINNKRGFHKA